MGLLFNTDGTLEILALLNSRFAKHNFIALQGSAALQNTLSNLTGNVNANGIFSKVCIPLGIDGKHASISGNWKAFLDILDRSSCPSQSPHPPANPTIAGEIGRAISLALQNTAPWQNVTSIEFFAVPQSQTKPTLTIGTVQDSKLDVTMFVTVTTTTYDKVTAV
jgi:hypothetical protein